MERDSLAAANIVAYLKDRPEQKGLVFYGSGHLIKRPDYKSAGGGEPSEEDKGYYLAYYLKGEFGDGRSSQ